MNLRNAQQSEPSCDGVLATGATRHISRSNAQLTEPNLLIHTKPGATRHNTWRNAPSTKTLPVFFPFYAQRAASHGATR
ncbi:hypothetical protein A2U01_0083409, partial [Trifolium medium]|nr:hypothetical protein [Trifolium medium]